MTLLADLRVLYHLVLRPVRGASHAERLQSFYAGQAGDYDAFRERLLPGRRTLVERATLPADGVWVDLGGGTGALLDLAGPRLDALARAYVVDLTPALLSRARLRIGQRGWAHVTAVETDATSFVPPGPPADLVTLSYALTMMPDWFAVVDQAWRILRPGGQIAVADYFVSRRAEDGGRVQHGAFTRAFWPTWMGLDHVHPSPDHLPYLQHRFKTTWLHQGRARLPYLPFVTAPYYLFLGEKSAEE